MAVRSVQDESARAPDQQRHEDKPEKQIKSGPLQLNRYGDKSQPERGRNREQVSRPVLRMKAIEE